MIAALLVTHNSSQFIEQTLKSISNQTRQPDIRIAIDDHSSDNTVRILEESGFTVIKSTTASSDVTTRIAQNFVQGVNCCVERGATAIILGDHDDVWYPYRIEHQVNMLNQNPEIALLASDGLTGEESTLRTTFPVPENFNDLDKTTQWKYVSKHSVVTGGASAIVPTNLSTIEVPEGWLHDRWWSLRAVRERAIRIDQMVVIEYQLSSQQQVGLNTRGQQNFLTRAAFQLQNIPLMTKKMRNISALLGEE